MRGRASTCRRFVVLEHRWGGVHWDLMLEDGPRLRTWALREAPAPGPVIEAGALADHRPAYLDYEGPISGDRGEVRRFDRGVYVPLLWGPDRVVVRLHGDRLVGEADLMRLGSRHPEDVHDPWTFRLTSLPASSTESRSV